MKIDKSKDWWLEMARLEGGSEVGAGLLALNPEVKEAPARISSAIEIAFGRFIQMMRRKHGLSLETLASRTDIDLEELISIEENPAYKPEPRTIYQLSSIFKVSNKKLLELAGLVTTKDSDLRQEAVRFAARSENVEKLSQIEKAALESFITILSEHDEKGGK